MQYFYVKNWSRFQHYKHRNPPWVKLHCEIFTSQDWSLLADASKLLAIVCMVVASRLEGRVPDDPAYIKRIAYLDHLPNLNPLIECGFLTKTQALASESKQLRTNADPENRVQRTDTYRSQPNGKSNGESGKLAKKKPRHGSRTKDGKRVWFDISSIEYAQYADDYQKSHDGILPKTLWDNTGAWFNWAGEQR